MIILGLTGSIGMGKSETAKMFEAFGIPVYDADHAVHQLYAKGGAAVGPLEAAFPGISVQGAIDRGRLGAAVLDDPDSLARLEAIVHPLVVQAQAAFLERARHSGAKLVVLDIPLLLETGGAKRVDKVLVVSASPETQRQRVLARPLMTVDKLAAILKRQMPDASKRRQADFIIDTDHGLDHARDQVKALIDRLLLETKHA